MGCLCDNEPRPQEEASEHRGIAVKIVDDRGIESLNVMERDG